MADGSYARVFNDYFGELIRRSAPLARRELWFQPGHFRK